MSSKHVVLVVFFVDSELESYIEEQPENLEGVYSHVIAEKFSFEKKLIVNELRRNGIYSLLTKPENLSVNVINKYIEIKNNQKI